MKLDIVCKVTNGKGAVEKHGPNPNPVFDAKITVGLTNEQMIELYGAGSEEAVSRYWDKNGNPNLGMTGTRKENDSFQIKDVEVTCQGVTIESCTISSITVEPEKGYIAAVAFNIRGQPVLRGYRRCHRVLLAGNRDNSCSCGQQQRRQPGV